MLLAIGPNKVFLIPDSRDKLDHFEPQDEIGEKVVKWYLWRKAHGSGSSYID